MALEGDRRGKRSKVRKEVRMQRRRGLLALDRYKMVLSRALAALVASSQLYMLYINTMSKLFSTL